MNYQPILTTIHSMKFIHNYLQINEQYTQSNINKPSMKCTTKCVYCMSESNESPTVLWSAVLGNVYEQS